MGDSELTDVTDAPGRPAGDIKAVPVRRPGRWLAAFAVLVIAASIVRSIVTNKRFDWGLVWHYMGDPRVIHGVIATLYLTGLAMSIGVILGILLAVMRLSPNPIVSGASWLYIYFFRGTPLLVQIVFWYNIAALFPVIGLGIPFGPSLVHLNGNTLITQFVAALLGLGLNEGAYMAEIVRAGIISVDEGQSEAASSLGMGRLQIMRHIVLPQAMRVILPPTGNETISMLKNTSLVSVIAFAELYYETSEIAASNFKTIQLLIVASLWYLIMTSVAYVGQYFLERKVGEGFSRTERVTMRDRWLAFGAGSRFQ
ncbi:MAG TPA: amino acid ABC transporter permease [Solirubrobacteraceae bacterium]|jgi:polar amino acid transport system permease protein